MSSEIQQGHMFASLWEACFWIPALISLTFDTKEAEDSFFAWMNINPEQTNYGQWKV